MAKNFHNIITLQPLGRACISRARTQKTKLLKVLLAVAGKSFGLYFTTAIGRQILSSDNDGHPWDYPDCPG
ncbi:hypothetical protein OUZ56_010142 [Daphnia magna]|uniref:Uncharacterized protein n=1 Tax=Daphnia magna TaxID=35525 RepID=A0ABR0AHX8_9CRUS|nr:hypothetical protein OUZ56_010142 [Daphnia magna]